MHLFQCHTNLCILCWTADSRAAFSYRDVRCYSQKANFSFSSASFRQMVANSCKLFSGCFLTHPKWRLRWINFLYACSDKNMKMFTETILYIRSCIKLTQQAHNIKMTSYQRRCDVTSKSKWRRINVDATWHQNDVVSTSMRRDHVASTLIRRRRHFDVVCLLG